MFQSLRGMHVLHAILLLLYLLAGCATLPPADAASAMRQRTLSSGAAYMYYSHEL